MNYETNRKKESEIDPRELKLKDLSLSGDTVNPLFDRGIYTLGDVTKQTKEFYRKISCYRKSSLGELENTLKKYGLEFKKNLKNLLLRPIEDLDLSEELYVYLKARNIDTVRACVSSFSNVDKKEAVELLVKMKKLGIEEEISYLIKNSDKYMPIRVKQYPVQNNLEYMEGLLPYIASRFMEYTISALPKNWRRLYLTSKDRTIEEKEEIYKECKKIISYFKNYTRNFTKIVTEEYELCVYDFSKKECNLMIKKIKEYLKELFDVLEEKEKMFYDITSKMEKCSQLKLSDVNKLKLYFPLVLESAVCRALLPYTEKEDYIQNEEKYEIKYSKNATVIMRIELEYVAKDMENATYKKRIKPQKRSSYSRSSSSCSSYSRSSSSYSSYRDDSFGEKLRSEIAGTAMFLRGFLPF